MSAKKAAPVRRLPVFWIVFGLIVVVGVIGILVASSGNDGGGNEAAGEFGTVTVSGAALPRFVAGGADPAVGTKAPVVTTQDFSGRTVTLEPDGNAHMVVFLAHWCPHCNREAPRLRRAIGNGVPDGVVVDIVPTGSNELQPNWPPSQWVSDEGLGGLDSFVDSEDGRIAAAYGLDGFPYIVELDRDFNVVARFSGEQAEGFFPEQFDRLANL